MVRPAHGRSPESTIDVAVGIGDAIVILREWLERFMADQTENAPTGDAHDTHWQAPPKG